MLAKSALWNIILTPMNAGAETGQLGLMLQAKKDPGR
jgi:hypothetical protein